MISTAVEPEALRLLVGVDLFDGLSEDALAALAPQLGWVEVPAGGEVFHEGDPSDCLFVLLKGRMDLTQVHDGVERQVAEVAMGETVGEIGLLLGGARTATARARRPCLLVRLDASAFDRLVIASPGSILPLTRRIARRLVTTTRRDPTSTRGITVVTASAGRVGASRLWRALVPLLERIPETRCLDRATLAAAAGSGDLQAAARWLDDCCRRGGQAFLLAAGTRDRDLLDLADRVVIVADAGARIDVGPVGREVVARRDRGAPIPVGLVLLHDGGSEASDTGRWLERFRPVAHVHVRRDAPTDLRRLSRWLSGRSIEVVLGGTGARSFGCIGALRALEEAGVPVDGVTATSIAAVIGAQYAAGATTAELLETSTRRWARARWELAVPAVALLRGQALRSLTNELFGDRGLEDLWLGYTCTTFDLAAGREVVHHAGPLDRWVRAAASVPGIHPPVVDSGGLHVDGAVVDSLPVRAARQREIGHLVAIDPSPIRAYGVDQHLDEAPRGLSWLAANIPILGTGFPGVGWMVDRAINAAQRRSGRSNGDGADLLIELPTEGFRLTDYHRVADIARLGYEETARRLEQDVRVIS